MRRYVSSAVLAVTVAWFPSPRASAEQEPKPRYLKTLIDNDSGNRRAGSEDRKNDTRLAATLAGIRRAFEDNDARKLDDRLDPTGRIHVSLQQEAGYYRRSQVMFMLKKQLDERETRSFTFDPVELDSADDSSSHVHAQWSYTVGDDEKVTEHLRFKLLRRNDDWYISEILTVPR